MLEFFLQSNPRCWVTFELLQGVTGFACVGCLFAVRKVCKGYMTGDGLYV